VKNPIRYGEKWAGLSAIALFGFLFMDWFGTPATFYAVGAEARVETAGGVAGWDSLGWLALALCILAIAAGLAVPMIFGLWESPVLPLATAICALLLGILAAIAIVVENIFQPGPDELITVLSGWWLGLLAALGIARGGYLSIHDEYLIAQPMPDVEVRPAPAA
jgi:hypothetical protein